LHRHEGQHQLLAFRSRQHRFAGLPVLLLDVSVEYSPEAELIGALCERAPAVCATLPRGDNRSNVNWRRGAA